MWIYILNVIMLWITSLIFGISKLASCTVMTNRVVMSRHPELDGKNVTSLVIRPSPEFDQETMSTRSCARRCADMTECSSFFYNSITNQCHLRRDLILTKSRSTTEYGLRYYYKIVGGSSPVAQCPEWNGYQLLTNNGPCVKFHTSRNSWYEVNEMCVSAYPPYSRLVVLDNQETNQVVQAAVVVKNYSFARRIAIGMSKQPSKSFRWVDGSSKQFTDWGDEEWSSGTEDTCVMLYRDYGWKWVAKLCKYDVTHYICEVAVDMQVYPKLMNIVS